MKNIPTGIEDFKELFDDNYYFVDKSNFIEIVMKNKVSLYTRPRRFGKTLNMSMLYYFFSNLEKENAYLFNDLKISNNIEIMKHQNQYPVILISLKDVKDNNFDSAIYAYKCILSRIVDKYKVLYESNRINALDKNKLKQLGNETANLEELKQSLKTLTYCLEKHYGQKVILLIDEYDVPLQAAYQNNYYDEMINFISSLFSAALKTNDSLFKGVMTGCLRISKESIFTGLNNFRVYSIFDDIASDCFGFTQNEIDEILKYYHLIDKKEKIQDWYDGYRFGNHDIYNPWSTLYYISNLLTNNNREPESHWANTSSNSLVYDYIKNSNREIKDEFEQLVQHKSIIKKIKPELTYREMDSIDNIYSFLLFTGYLKVKENLGNDTYELVIPNSEVYKIYDNHFMDYFRESTQDRRKVFVEALKNENVDQANDILNDILFESVSFYDNYENFYHGFLVGLLSGNKVESNRESGQGRFDIVIKPYNIFHKCIVIECKKTENPLDIEKDAMSGARQIIDKKYIEGLNQQGYRNVIGYSIAFYQKSCYIVKA